MKCNKCNSDIPNDSEFCPICGNKIEEIEKEKKTISISFKKAVILFVIGIIIIGIVATLIFYKKINNYSEDSNIKQNSNEDTKELYLKDIAKVGDYIEYRAEDKNFFVESEKSGYKDIQHFNTAKYTGNWQVLYNDNENGLQIVSSSNVAQLYLKGLKGYNNSRDVLNKFSQNYLNSNYGTAARSIGTNPVNYKTNEQYQDFTNWPYSYDGTEYNEYGDKIKDYRQFNGKFKASSDEYKKDRDIILKLGLNDESFWYASRTIYYSSSLLFEIAINNPNNPLETNTKTHDNLLYKIDFTQVLNNSGNTIIDWTVDNYEFEDVDGVRPVIVLKNDLIVESGNGTKENPYILKTDESNEDTENSMTNQENFEIVTKANNSYEGYKKVLQIFNKEAKEINSQDPSGIGVMDFRYGLVDINNDNIKELVICFGTCNADMEFTFYTYKNNNVIKLGENGASNSTLYKMNNGNYLKQVQMSMRI